MANVANTLATGPTSKDAISGGRKLAVKTNEADMSGHDLSRLGNNTTEEARRTIMSMRVQSTPHLTTTPQATMNAMKSKRNVSNIPNSDFSSTR